MTLWSTSFLYTFTKQLLFFRQGVRKCIHYFRWAEDRFAEYNPLPRVNAQLIFCPSENPHCFRTMCQLFFIWQEKPESVVVPLGYY